MYTICVHTKWINEAEASENKTKEPVAGVLQFSKPKKNWKDFQHFFFSFYRQNYDCIHRSQFIIFISQFNVMIEK